MADKIAVNDENYTDLKSALEGKHEIILELLEKSYQRLARIDRKRWRILYGCNFSKSKSFM